MSATFKNAKKSKLTQRELRRYMNEHKSKNEGSSKKINSPLAKYNDAGQLMCILCKSIVKSEAVWTVHINAKQHKEKIEAAKRQSTAPKRTIAVTEEVVPQKKIKGILTNKTDQTNTSVQEFVNTNKTESKVEEIPKESSETLPEGFFDDPKMDAKARNLEYKDPVEEEWEKFQREIKEADFESSAIIAEDQEEATNERQIDEIEEQMSNWSRVLNLERKKQDIISSVKNENNDVDKDSNDEDIEFDEYFDWRSKESFA